MKSLYVNLNKEQVDSTDSYEVLNYNLLDDFFFYLGDAIVGNTGIKVEKIDLIKDFNTQENASEFSKIMKQWEEMKMALFGELPKGYFKIMLPNAYLDWLQYNSCIAYRDIYNVQYAKNRDNVVNIDIEDFYTTCLVNDLLRKIIKLKKELSFNEIVIGINKIQKSLFIKEVMNRTLLKVAFGHICNYMLAYVKKDDKYGFINANGNLVVPLIYDRASYFQDGLAYVKIYNEWKGMIDTKGNRIFTSKYNDSHFEVPNYTGGLLNVELEWEKYGYVDLSGNQVSALYDFTGHFNDGLAMVKNGNKYGFVNIKGELAIPCIYDHALSFSEGLAAVGNNGKYGFINTKGHLVIPYIYDHVYCYFSNGIVAVKQKDKFGYIDRQGKQIIPFKYDYASPFKNGLADVKINGKYGYINTQGELVVPCIYDECGYFNNGLAAVKTNGKYGYIDIQGKLVIPCIFDRAYKFVNGLASIERNGKYGFINTKGDIAIPCIYDFASNFSEGVVLERL